MIIISHRGYWKTATEKNTIEAFSRSFSLGFGTETDIRDYHGELVISHDIADESCITFDNFINIYLNESKGTLQPLALNVKSDGLQSKIKDKLSQFSIENYFLFDMSIPDTLGYLDQGLNTFVRYSEYEPLTALLEQSQGVWLDGFSNNLVNADLLELVLGQGKKVCIVSPELHKRGHLEVWQQYKTLPERLIQNNNLILCTDLPENALEFFNDK